ncbi:interleukin-3 receptor subunit alpha-like isoform 3-T4 [Trichechus inunguis]
MQSGEFRAFHETSFHHVIICVFPGGANAFWCLAHFPAGAEPTMSVIWLSVFLMPVSCLLERDPDGKPGAAAENLTCWIHDVDFLECSWAVGRAAPWDVQYHLYLIQPDTYEEWECVHYTTDTHGRRTGGCFDDISGLRNDHYHFLVNGTSEASRIPCTELFATLSEIEILAPPSISGTCNKSYSLMEWKMSSHFSSDFVYELQIYKGADPTHLDTHTVIDKNSYELVNPGTYTARIRGKNNLGYFGKTWSSWSPPRSFECDNDRSLGAWPMMLSIVLGTLLTVLLVVLLCRRFSVVQKIFPPVPGIRDPIKDFFHNNRLVDWEAGAEGWQECSVEEVQAVGET